MAVVSAPILFRYKEQMPSETTIHTPDDAQLDELCTRLRALSTDLDRSGHWPEEQLRLCGEYGVYRWFLPTEWGGLDWNEEQVVRGYLKLSAACLTTTFILTQRTGGCRRIVASDNATLQERYLPRLASGECFTTLGISHLTTSRQHLQRPVLLASETSGGYRLEGFSPWVTGAAHAEIVVTGATLADGRQILLAVPTEPAEIAAGEPAALIGLMSSHTGPLNFDAAEVPEEFVVAGPVENLMQGGGGGATGGLQTSTLAVGLAREAIDYLASEAEHRDELADARESLEAEYQQIESELLAMAAGRSICSNEAMRTQANSLVNRAAQAALAASKGAGYVIGHPAGRMCREALFFHVWSCPQPVLQASLCELAGIE